MKQAMVPKHIRFHRLSKLLDLEYDDGKGYQLHAGFLRLHSPSAASHYKIDHWAQGASECVSVNISGMEQVGNYALRIFFTDGHDSGIYTWQYLKELAETKWPLEKHLFRAENAEPSASEGAESVGRDDLPENDGVLNDGVAEDSRPKQAVVKVYKP